MPPFENFLSFESPDSFRQQDIRTQEENVITYGYRYMLARKIFFNYRPRTDPDIHAGS